MTVSPDGGSRADCELCLEVELAGTAATGVGGRHRPAFSRLIRRTSIVDVYAGLGSIAPGYVLIVPRRHVTSIGMLSRGEIRHALEVARSTAAMVTEAFQRATVLVEHGSSGDARRAGRACIEHAHMHIFPVGFEVDPKKFTPARSRRIPAWHELAIASSTDRNYYYCMSGQEMEGYFLEDPKVESQFARRIWARHLGNPDMWDWAAFPFYENCRVTVMKLRRDVLVTDEPPSAPAAPGLTETIKAYDQEAEWYSDRTAAFPEETSLLEEMRLLSDSTAGPVLDAGTGAGRDAAFFAALGRPVVALDAAYGLLRHVPSRPNIWPVLADIRKVPFEDHAFGAIWCSAVLVHLDSRGFLVALREFHRVLRPGGLVQISVKEGSGYSLQPIRGAESPRRRFFFYEAGEVMAMSRASEFDVVRSWTEDESDASDIVQRWVKVLLRRPLA